MNRIMFWAWISLCLLQNVSKAQGPLVQVQKEIQAAAAVAENSIATILVSRSPKYKELGAVPSPGGPGQLGAFHASQQTQGRRFRNVPDRNQAGLDLSDPDTVPDSFGTGVFLEKDLVLTLAHVVKNATKVFVRFPGNKGSYADIHALDGRSDLAVLRLIDPVQGIQPMPIAVGAGVSKGQFVVHLSNGFGSGFRDGSPAVGWSMVSNLRRKWTAADPDLDRNQIPLYQYGTLIQLDGPVKAGSSGGALISMDGKWVGILTTTAGWPGLDFSGGFAIPLDDNYKRIISVLKRGEEVEYGFLGVQIEPSGFGGPGVMIANVSANTPAANAGISRGDRIRGLNGQRIDTQEDLFFYTGTALAGSEVTLELDGPATANNQVAKVRLAKYLNASEVIASTQAEAPFGIRADYTSLLAQRPFGGNAWNRGVPSGVLIREVISGSPADQAKLQAGKIISRVNGQPLGSPADFYKALRAVGNSVRLVIVQTDGGEEQVDLSR